MTYHYLDGRPLMHWYSIDIVQEGDTKRVFFNSTIHVNKRVEINPSFSSEFTDQQILHDRNLTTNIYNRYGFDVIK